MFSRISFVALSFLAVFTSAASIARGDTPTTACCANTIPADSDKGKDIISTLGLDLKNVNAPFGISCVPVNAISVTSSSSCSNNTFNCDSVTSKGFGINCIPISL